MGKVVVLGSGPAGCAAAIVCARNGISTTLLSSALRRVRLPGESLHPAAEMIFDRLGIGDPVRSARFSRYAGHWVSNCGKKAWQPFGSDHRGTWMGFHALRPELDAILLKGAAQSGVEVRGGAPPRDVLSKSGRVLGVSTSAGTLEADFVIDGTGTPAWLRRKLSVPALTASPPLVARFGWCNEQRREAAVFTPCANGYTWRAQVLPNVSAWTRLGFDNKGAGPGRDVTWRVAIPAAGPGYFLAGDAAYQLDPAFSRGVLKAMMTGMTAGTAVSDILSGRAPEVRQTASYSRWVRDRFCYDAQTLLAMYSEFEFPPAWAGDSRTTLSSIRNMPC